MNKKIIFFIMLSLFSLAFASVDSIKETVTIDNFIFGHGKTEIELSDYQMQEFKQGLRKTDYICQSLQTALFIYDCTVELNKNSKKIIITYNLRTNLILGVIGVRAQNNKIKIEFYAQFPTVASIISEHTKNHKVIVSLPDGKNYVNSGKRKDQILQKFTIENFPLDLDFAVEYDTLGNVITYSIDKKGLYCISEIVNDNNVVYAQSATSNCNKLLLSVSSLAEETDLNAIVYLIDEKFTIYAGLTELEFKRPPFEINSIFVEDSDKYSLYIDEKDYPCTINLYNFDKRQIWTRPFSSCQANETITFKGALPPDLYYVEVVMRKNKKTSKQTHIFQVESINKILRIQTDKEIYYAGEEIKLTVEPEDQIEHCSIKMMDLAGNQVWPSGEAIPQACGNLKIVTDTILRPGPYYIDIAIYAFNAEISKHRKLITVAQASSTILEDSILCENNLFYLAEEESNMPCISSGQACMPRAMKVPNCLCFNRVGAMIDVCEFGQVCGEQKCTGGDDVVNRIISSIDGNDYLLHKNGISPFVQSAELCIGTCACVDKQYDIKDWCSPGEVCMPQKECCLPELNAYIMKISPKRVPKSELAKGTTLEVFFKLKRGDLPVKDYFNAFVYIGGEKYKTQLLNYRGVWVASANLKTLLNPGKHIMVFEIQTDTIDENDGCGSNSYALRIPFTVLFDQGAKINVKIKKPTPSVISQAQAEKGIIMALKAEVNDDLINSEHITVSFGNKKMRILSVEKIGNTYDLIVLVNGSFVIDKTYINVSVSRLGKYGEAIYPFTLPKHLDVKIDTIVVDPPLIWEQYLTGFELNLIVSVQADDISKIKRNHFTIEISGKDKRFKKSFTPDVMILGPEGFILRKYNVDYCSLLPSFDITNKEKLDLKVKMLYKTSSQTSYKSYEDTESISIHPCFNDPFRGDTGFCGLSHYMNINWGCGWT